MTLVDAISSLRDWSPPLNWAARIDRIWKTTISQKQIDGNYEQYIKIALSWVVVSRMVIAHLYTITYAANLYTILTWCRAKVLLPWLMLSAFKNFFLESIVILVVILLYIEGNLSGFLFMSIMMDKLISFGKNLYAFMSEEFIFFFVGSTNQISKLLYGHMNVPAVAAHNWFTINSFYVELEKKNLRESHLMNQQSNTSFSTNILLGMSMQNTLLADDNMIDPFIDRPNTFSSLPNLGSLDFISDTDSYDKFSPSNSIISTSIDNRYDRRKHESHIDIIDDSNIIATENAIGILRLTLDDIEKNSGRIELESDAKTSNDFIPLIDSTGSNEYNNVSTSCNCSTIEGAGAESEVQTDGNSLTKDGRSKRDENETKKRNIGNHTNWVNQWSLNQLLECTKSKSNEKEDGTSTLINEDYFSRWSSDEDLNSSPNSIDNVNDENNVADSNQNFTTYCLPDISFARMKSIDFYKQPCKSWIEYLQFVGSSFETTLQNQQINNETNQFSSYNPERLLNKSATGVKIKKSWILDGMSIELVENEPECLPDEQDMFMKPKLNLSSMKDCETVVRPSVQINFDKTTDVGIDNDIGPSYETSATQTSIHELTSKYSYYKSLSMYNPSNKRSSEYETAYEREEKELEALRAYNARTLWKDKQKMDTEKFKSMHDGESQLLSKSQSLKSNNENQSSKRKQRYQSKNIGGAKKFTGNLKMNSVSCKKIQVTQVGRHLNRIKASENIHSRYPIKVPQRLRTVDTTAEHCSNQLAPAANSQSPSSTREEFHIKNVIAQIDWTLSPWEPYDDYDTLLSKSTFKAEPVMSDIVDENETADLLRSAFSFDTRNTERGFYLGPASTDLYSVSEQIPNVFHEIIKAARFRTIRIECSRSWTMEIDYGETYYQELTTIGGSNVLSKKEYLEGPESLNNSEMFAIDFWIKTLQKLPLNLERNDNDLTKIKQLTQMPGFLVLQRLIDEVRSSLMISVSTSTSRLSITTIQLATTSNATTNNYSIDMRIPKRNP